MWPTSKILKFYFRDNFDAHLIDDYVMVYSYVMIRIQT
jgi:hypothetical protein